MVLNKNFVAVNENEYIREKNNKSFNVKEYGICEFYISTKCWMKKASIE